MKEGGSLKGQFYFIKAFRTYMYALEFEKKARHSGSDKDFP